VANIHEIAKKRPLCKIYFSENQHFSTPFTTAERMCIRERDFRPDYYTFADFNLYDPARRRKAGLEQFPFRSGMQTGMCLQAVYEASPDLF
jgi:hypothetical protein